MTTTHATRPDTVMGRALSARVVELRRALAPQGEALPSAEIDLTLPETPSLPAPVREAAGAALDRGETHYTTRPGVTALREAIAQRLTNEGFPASADDMLITNGGSEALYIALQTLLAPGQRIIVASPTPPNVIAMIRFIGGEPVQLPADRAGGFVPSVEAIESAEASAILIASPSPVSGLALSSSELASIIAAALRHDMTIFLDRSLATALYDPAHARFDDPELAAKVVIIGSFSTGHGLTGWRVGWLAASAEQMKRPRVLKQEMSICTTAVSQYAAMAIFDDPDDWTATRRNEFARRRDQVMARLRTTNLSAVEPDAYPALLIDVRALDDDDRRVAARLREEVGVVVQPGSTFGPATAGFVRLDLGVPEKILWDGIERLATFVKGASA
jgi:aspartate/methionine/tyrosine aminotransferase